MLDITPQAQQQIRRLLRQAGRESHWLRVEVVGRDADDFMYRLIFLPADQRRPEDSPHQVGQVQVLLDPLSARYLQGAALRYVEGPQETGFKIDNPNPLWLDPLGARVQQIIEGQINPGIAVHGGRVTLLDVDQGVAYINMSGGCQGCGMANVTLKQGVERMIQQAVPQITRVVDTTEHALGVNPYYSTPQGESPLG